MKSTHVASLVSFAALTLSLPLALVTGCSSSTGGDDPFGPEPDYGTLEAQFASPTGTFTKGKESSVLAAFNMQQQASKQTGATGAPGFGGFAQSSGVKPQSLRFLGEESSGLGKSCQALESGNTVGTCACPEGGSFVYDVSGLSAAQQSRGPIDARMKMRFNACASSGTTIDGRQLARIKTSGEDDARKMSMLLDAHLTVSRGAEKQQVDFTFLYEEGRFWLSVGVDDGTVVVGTTSGWNDEASTGSLFVRDRTGTFTCDLTGGKGACTSDKGEQRQL